MKVLVVGSGGREHTLVWKIRQSPLVGRIYAAPGNPGMAEEGARCIPIAAMDVNALADFAYHNGIDLTVPGGEEPLALGIVDMWQERGLKIFGPSQKATQLEADKEYALCLMHWYNIPTGWYQAYDLPDDVFHFLGGFSSPFPVVIKNPYPAKGKGSFVCQKEEEVRQALFNIMRQQAERGDRRRFLVMEFLKGEEVSITALSDGEHLVYLPPSQDHKRLLEGDQGPMTGGMGAIAPAPYITPELQAVIHERIMLPTVRAMAEEGRPYKGVLYAGLILTDDGPKVLEFNARFGDPEAQVILPLLRTDLVELMLSAIDGSLDKVKVEFENKAAACVVLASDWYGYTDDRPSPSDRLSDNRD